MNFSKITLSTLVFTLSLFAFTPSYAEQEYRDFSKMTPDATFDFTIKSAKLIIGTSWGNGTLHYQGKAYPVDLLALSAGGLGFKKAEGTANVYGLKQLADFAGKYAGGSVGATAGKKSTPTQGTFENPKRVVIVIDKGKSQGLQLSASLGGFEIEFED